MVEYISLSDEKKNAFREERKKALFNDIASLTHKLSTPLCELHEGVLYFLAGGKMHQVIQLQALDNDKESSSLRKNFFDSQMRTYFNFAREAFERKMKVLVPETINEVRTSKQGSAVLVYAHTLNHLIGLSDEKQDKIKYLNKLYTVTEQLLKKEDQCINSGTWFTDLAQADRIKDYFTKESLHDVYTQFPTAVLLSIDLYRQQLQDPDFVPPVFTNLINSWKKKDKGYGEKIENPSSGSEDK
jgi:hypothetical protein